MRLSPSLSGKFDIVSLRECYVVNVLQDFVRNSILKIKELKNESYSCLCLLCPCSGRGLLKMALLRINLRVSFNLLDDKHERLSSKNGTFSVTAYSFTVVKANKLEVVLIHS